MARCEGGPNLLEDLSTKGRKRLLQEGPRVKMGFIATPERGDIPWGNRLEREEDDAAGFYVPRLEARAEHPPDMPPGCRGAWPTSGNWGDTTRRALSHTNARWTQNTNALCHFNIKPI